MILFVCSHANKTQNKPTVSAFLSVPTVDWCVMIGSTFHDVAHDPPSECGCNPYKAILCVYIIIISIGSLERRTKTGSRVCAFAYFSSNGWHFDELQNGLVESGKVCGSRGFRSRTLATRETCFIASDILTDAHRPWL